MSDLENKYPLVNETSVGSAEPTPEQHADVVRQMRLMLDLFNETPQPLRETVAISFFVSLCMSTTSPEATFAAI